ncbi:MAG: uroporphyrinogen-III synthase [Aquabacterium sp.]|uniref:uroporphyrinogen-III synthase n=1 Tax=Aquabacterium sp. TaxID=1872578 RepID=UPI0011F58292|nr:uroporphyrinogen-III synthase [Aquabacterium sp.]TAK87648.1 MAG: uroporphyrinogen-III synthase [Aquabacterium sp.]
MAGGALIPSPAPSSSVQGLQVLVTRPEPQASIWAADLQSNGLDAHVLPLIAIGGPADPAPVAHLWQNLASQRLLMFVSPAAVHWFFQLRPHGAIWPAGTLAASPGPGTAHSLMLAGEDAGLTSAQIICPDASAEQFDSETLWPLLAPLDWQGQQVAIISGGDQQEAKGRNWLSEQWRARGATVQSVLTYQRGPGEWTPSQQALAAQALQHPAQHAWLFSSSQAIDHLVEHHLPAHGLHCQDWSAAHAVVTHPKIAERCQQLGIQRITSTRPTLSAVVEALRSAE